MSNVINPKLGIFQKTPRIPLASLPSAALFQSITRYEISDYGGNVAVAVGGQWRFELPFRTTWAARPPVGLVPAGTELQVTDYNNQKFISNGTYWRPAQGRVQLRSLIGDTFSPLAVISGVASGNFLVAGGLKIPAGMIIPGGTVAYLSSEFVKVGANGTAVGGAWLGKNGTQSDSQCQLANIAIGNNTSCLNSVAVKFSSNPGRFTTRTYVGYGSAGSTTANQIITQSGVNIDASADMYFTIGINSGNTLDAWNLIAVNTWLEG